MRPHLSRLPSTLNDCRRRRPGPHCGRTRAAATEPVTSGTRNGTSSRVYLAREGLAEILSVSCLAPPSGARAGPTAPGCSVHERSDSTRAPHPSCRRHRRNSDARRPRPGPAVHARVGLAGLQGSRPRHRERQHRVPGSDHEGRPAADIVIYAIGLFGHVEKSKAARAGARRDGSYDSGQGQRARAVSSSDADRMSANAMTRTAA